MTNKTKSNRTNFYSIIEILSGNNVEVFCNVRNNMSEDVCEIVKSMDKESLDTQLALQCAPFISGLRMSNLLTVKKDQYADLVRIANKSDWNIKVLAVNKTGRQLWQITVTVLVYHEKALMEYLSSPEVCELLINMGYDSYAVGSHDLKMLIDTFAHRYSSCRKGECKFPDEMGVFLGYPIEDVEGYIDNGGKNCLYTSYWKVYSNPEEKFRLFNNYEKAKENIIRYLAMGYNMPEVIALYA